MDAIEKRARELLAAQCETDGMPDAAEMVRAGTFKGDAADGFQTTIRALIAALTPPEGYVLVPVEPTEAQLDRATWEEVGGHCSSCTAWPASHSDARRVWAAILAARPEVPNG